MLNFFPAFFHLLRNASVGGSWKAEQSELQVLGIWGGSEIVKAMKERVQINPPPNTERGQDHRAPAQPPPTSPWGGLALMLTLHIWPHF